MHYNYKLDEKILKALIHETYNTILEHPNNKQKLQILEALHIKNMQPTLNRINFQTVLMFLNVFSYWY